MSGAIFKRLPQHVGPTRAGLSLDILYAKASQRLTLLKGLGDVTAKRAGEG
jgi:hypothetical protein